MRTYQIETAGLTDTGQVRAVNEDQLISEGDLFAVADGMGGLGHGQTAARLALEQLQAGFAANSTAEGLVVAVDRANQEVFERGLALADGDDPPVLGTTIAAVAYVVEDGADQLVVVNVGDSRVYRLRNGQLKQLSTDHSQVADLVRAGAISAEQAADHPERHILTKALGVAPEVEATVNRSEPSPGDRLLLCSDGLYNEVTEAELVDVLRANAPADDVAARLILLANERGGNDNITALVLDVS